MFGESESESPRVPSPWDAILSGAHVEARNHQCKPGFPKLAAEVEEGNIEYKLHLINPSPARFARLVTQMKWRLLEGGGQAIYELGVADSGALVGLCPGDLRATLDTLHAMASEIGARVTIMREIEVTGVDAHQGDLSELTSQWHKDRNNRYMQIRNILEAHTFAVKRGSPSSAITDIYTTPSSSAAYTTPLTAGSPSLVPSSTPSSPPSPPVLVSDFLTGARLVSTTDASMAVCAGDSPPFRPAIDSLSANHLSPRAIPTKAPEPLFNTDAEVPAAHLEVSKQSIFYDLYRTNQGVAATSTPETGADPSSDSLQGGGRPHPGVMRSSEVTSGISALEERRRIIVEVMVVRELDYEEEFLDFACF
ncbi:hypothetical protein BC834DRAFT_911036 [Gloeopeniophorella convolvens]|nr:hypothetical protein BC834DRAFT_911036 [Gloeopeniophorella convolvens]